MMCFVVWYLPAQLHGVLHGMVCCIDIYAAFVHRIFMFLNNLRAGLVCDPPVPPLAVSVA